MGYHFVISLLMEFTILKASECNINPLKKSIVKEVASLKPSNFKLDQM